MSDHVVVGTAGHIDHGKSTLVRALTGIDPDRWEEEKRRGITIDLGFAHLEHRQVLFAFVDVPGHERFVHNMLAGASGIDIVMLVVAADESVMPQTREHLAICDLLGARHGLVALTRIDLADGETCEIAEQEVRELVQGTFLEGAPLVRVSGATGAGLDALRAALVEVARRVDEAPPGPWPRLPIDRVFAARGFGTIVTGTLQGGPLAVGEELVAIPGGRKGRIRGLQVHGESRPSVEPRHRVAVNLQGLAREHLGRGQVLVPPGHELTARVVDALVRVIDDAPVPIENRMRVRLHHGTAELMARVRLPAPGRIEPGRAAACQIRLERPAALLPGDRFVLRRYSPLQTLGGGVVCELDPPRRRLPATEWAARVARLASADAETRLALAVRDAGPSGLSLETARLRCGLPDDRAARLVSERGLAGEPEPVLLFGTDRLVAAGALGELLERLAGWLDRFHRDRPLVEGAPPERVRSEIAPRWDPAAVRDLLAEAERRGLVEAAAGLVRLAGRRVELDARSRDLLERLVRELDREEREPFLDEDELARRLGVPGGVPRELLDLACRRGEIVRVREGTYIGRRRFDEIVARLRQEEREGRRSIDVGRFKGLFGLSRKYAIPLLECLDDQGVTRRAGNVRVIRSTGG